MNYPFNLDELGAAMDDFKEAVLADVDEAHREVARLKADLERYDHYIMGWRNLAADLDRELRETKRANAGLKRTIEELLRRPDLEEDEPEDPKTLAEIAREHGWL